MFSYLPPILKRITWGVHINSERYFAPPPDCTDWLMPLQKQEWQNRDGVVWDATHRIVAHLYARYALKLLENLQKTDTWKSHRFIVGSPAYRIPIPNTRRKKDTKETGDELQQEGWVLTNKIELAPNQAAELFAPLTTEEDILKQIATDEDRQAREALGKVYSLIAGYGRKIREAKKDGREREEPPKRKIIPTALPKGSYFTVPQAAEICNVTPRKIKTWIRKGELEAINLPDLGVIIEVGKLNKLLLEKGILS